MRVTKCFRLAVNMLVHSKLRSWLTIIGIIIGIAAVIAIVSISEGAKANLQDRLGGLGADLITLSPGSSKARGAGFGGGDHPPDMGGGGFGGSTATSTTVQKNITNKDIMVIKTIPGIKAVEGEISGRTTVAFLTKSVSLNVRGVDPMLWKEVTTEKLASGRFLSKGDSDSVVIGGNLAKTFDNTIPLNSKITINGKVFKVVGILQEGPTIYMPIDFARDTLDNIGKDEFHSVIIKVADVNQIDNIMNVTTKKLMFARGIIGDKNKDFNLVSAKAMAETMQSTINTMALFLGAIAAISLVVGAVGIANSMFTSVLEKTKEIGIMKAIGTKNRDILLIFLFNAGLIGLIGGVGGILLGTFISNTISTMGGLSVAGAGGSRGFMSSISSIVTPEMIILALAFSLIIGMVAGAIPAYRASKLNPVDALRSE